MNKTGRIVRRGLVGAAIVLAALLLAGRICLAFFGAGLAARALSSALKTPVELGDLSLSLLAGKVVLRNFRLAQPDGFGEGEMAAFSRLELDLAARALLSGKIEVENFLLESPDIRLVKNADGKMNLAAFSGQTAPAASPAEEKPAGRVQALLHRAVITGGKLSYHDFSAQPPSGPAGETEAPPPSELDILIELWNLELEVSELRLDTCASAELSPPGEASLKADLRQGEFPDAPLSLAARVGPLGSGLPSLNAVFRLAGFELGEFQLIPAGASNALGGDIVDVALDCRLAPELLDAAVTVVAEGGVPVSLKVGGTPDKPEVDTSGVLFSVLALSGGGIGNLALGAGGAAYQVGAAAVNTVGAVGEGLFGVIGSVGEGLGGAVVGAATGDLARVGDGLTQATVGTAGAAGDAAAAVGGEVAEGAGKTVAAASGADREAARREGLEARWEKAWAEALRALSLMPWPPARPGAEPEGA